METTSQTKALTEAQEELLMLFKKYFESKDQLNLSGLVHLEKLSSLDQLKELEQLTILEQLASLGNLQELQALDSLNKLESLNQLEKLEVLSSLQQLDELKRLKSLEELEKLSSLEELQNLEKLSQLNKLSSLENLKELNKLDQLLYLKDALEKHQTTLAPLAKLDQLDNLNNLTVLDELKKLDKLESLSSLDKLNLLQDAQLKENLDKLDELDYLKKGVKYIAIQQASSFLLELVKLTLVAAAIVFFLTRESGREIISKALPAIGLGNSAQVNLGLRLIVGETAPEQFSEILNDVKSRIKNEIKIIFGPSMYTSLNSRLSSLENVNHYSFKYVDVDLKKDTESLLKKESNLFLEDTISRLDYDATIAKAKENNELHAKLREIKLLLSQEKFTTVIEKAHSYWFTNEPLRASVIYSATVLAQNDPKTLESILKNLPPIGGVK